VLVPLITQAIDKFMEGGNADGKTDELTLDDLSHVARHLRFEFYEKDEYIYKFGDKGDKFFLLLHGQASVLVPQKKSFHEK